MTGPPANALARTLRGFFTEYLPRLRGLSVHTIHSYRDSLTLLLRFMLSQRGHTVDTLDLRHIDAVDVAAFLDHLEVGRRNAATTRNVRLAALHAFFRYAATTDPEQLGRSQRILAIPFKRARQRAIEYLEHNELQAILTAVDRATPEGRRDYALLATLFNTGARVQEVLDLRAHDLHLTRPFQVRLVGKRRKERHCPLWPQTAEVLRDLCAEHHMDLHAATPVFLNHRGHPLTRFGVRYLLAKYLQRARAATPALTHKRLHPHSIRHSTAVHLLKAGVDLSTICQWLGHASPTTTNRYAAVDLDMKREALARAHPPSADATAIANWRHDASILDWLEAL
jgi:site-specific recombinase XerD